MRYRMRSGLGFGHLHTTAAQLLPVLLLLLGVLLYAYQRNRLLQRLGAICIFSGTIFIIGLDNLGKFGVALCQEAKEHWLISLSLFALLVYEIGRYKGRRRR
jgi:hypothetical protein